MMREEMRVASGVLEPAGSARLELVSGVVLLHAEDAVLEAMLEGWAKQQFGGRGLAPGTVKQRRAVVRRDPRAFRRVSVELDGCPSR